MIWINIFFISIILFLLMFIYAFFETNWLKLKKYKIKITKPAFKGYKIIFVSDFHHSSLASKKYIQRVVEKINDLKPDLIVLGGDYVSTKSKYIEPLFKELKGLNATMGVYGVIGNHDINVDKKSILLNMEKANIKTLDNTSYWITKNNERIKLGGVADYLYDIPDINQTIYDTSPSDYVILVSHNPDYIEKIKNDRIDLMLSGHTHGGQVTIFGLYAPYIPSTYKQKYRTGLKFVYNTHLIITNGIGCVGVPLRFFARPQITQIEFTN